MTDTDWCAGVTVDLELLGRRAEAYVRGLVTETGARPAGSVAERQALDWIESRMGAQGYAFTRQRFRFPNPLAFFPYYSVVALAFVLSALLLPHFPWLALGLPFLASGLPDLYNWVTGLLPANSESENLVVLPRGSSLAQVDLIFCAHVDTARAIPSGYGARLFTPLRAQVFPLMQRLGWILAILGLLSGVGLQPGSGPFAAAVTVAALVALALVGLDIWEQLGERGRYTVGANDNASGVGVLLALAELYAQSSPGSLAVGFVFTGAEEAGLWGARHFARSLKNIGLRPPVVCVDMVGAGPNLRIMEGAKTLRMVKTDAQISEWLERADPLALRHTARRRSSDFEAFVHAGIPAGWIEGSGTAQSWKSYHTQRDQLDRIDPRALERAAALLFNLVEHHQRDMIRRQNKS